MPRYVKVSSDISESIGSFQLPRQVLTQLLARLHHDVVQDYHQFRGVRVADNEECYRHRITIIEGSWKYLFPLVIDDTTAQDFLIIVDIGFLKRPA